MTLATRLLARTMRAASRRTMRLAPVAASWSLPPPNPSHRYLLYVHVPFCPTLCPFCSFHRVEFQAAKAASYFPALRSQINAYADAGFELSGVYVGGGTPTVALDELLRTLDLIGDRFGQQLVSVETNPTDLKPDALRLLASRGVSRLSVGVQSLDDSLLRKMGRYETYGSSRAIVERLAAARGQFATLNVDMIFNLPDQSSASLLRDLHLLTEELRVDQISYYPLMVAGTTRRAIREQMGPVSEATEQAHYETIAQTMTDRGYRASSAWCFGRTAGPIDEYIVTDEEYLGAGSGAFGYIDGTFYANTFSLARYARLIAEQRSPITMARHMGLKEQARYDLLVKLFGGRLDKRAFAAKFGRSVWQLVPAELTILRTLGAIRDNGDQFELTAKGRYYWVVLMREFLTGVNRFREQLRHNLRDEFAARPSDGKFAVRS